MSRELNRKVMWLETLSRSEIVRISALLNLNPSCPYLVVNRNVLFWCYFHVRNEELHRVKEERNILHTVERRKATLTGHILRRNCFLKLINEGKTERRTEVTGRWGRDVSSCCMTVRKQQGTGNWKGEHQDYSLWKELWTCRKRDYGMNAS